MRIALVVALLLTAVLIMVSFAAADLRPNEVGRVMVLEYHKVDYPEERWTRTPENFRRDLETLYARGYRLQSLNDLLDGKITVPAGFSPVILTFDDSSPGQFRYVEQGGTLVVDPKCAVGVLEAFIAEKPDFGRGATFFVLPGASLQSALRTASRLQKLIEEENIPHAHSPVAAHITVSQGVITVSPGAGHTPADLIELADQALYDAKASGRNAISVK